jgi:hypothetical protein
MVDAEAKVASYFAKYTPAIAKLGKAVRAKMRARLPGLTEIVYLYENQKSLVIAYSPTERGGGSEALFSTAVTPDGVKLYFTRASELSKSDPNKLLQGSAKTVRFVALDTAADFDRAEIQDLMAIVLKLAKVRLDPKAKGSIVIKADEQKQRALRAKKVAASTPARRKAKARR